MDIAFKVSAGDALKFGLENLPGFDGFRIVYIYLTLK